jgi:spermidine/putrescine transport system permease protein
MKALIQSFGTGLSAALLALVGFWMLILVLVPQFAMLETSLWSREEAKGALDVTRAYNDLALLDYDITAEKDAAKKAELQAKADQMRKDIAAAEAGVATPEKVYGAQNYTRMSALHARIFFATIGYSILVTLLALIICYPIAYAVAFAPSGQRATVLITCLVIPYAMNELLRVYAWLMMFDYQGVINRTLAWLGIVSFENGTAIRFLESQGTIFAALVSVYILFMVFPIMNAMTSLDKNQIEAARDLGAGTIRIHRRVIIPHAKPGIAVGCITTFMLAVGSYAVPQTLSRGTGGDWFSQLVYRQFFEANNWNIGSAYAFSLLIVCLIFVFLCLKLFGVTLREITK